MEFNKRAIYIQRNNMRVYLLDNMGAIMKEEDLTMLDITILLDFYFTKYLFMASVFYGVCKLTRKLLIR